VEGNILIRVYPYLASSGRISNRYPNLRVKLPSLGVTNRLVREAVEQIGGSG
jgi:hypothetical protein